MLKSYQSTDTVDQQPEPAGLRWRAIAIGLLFSAVICLLTPVNNIYRQATPLGGGHFPLAPFILLLWMTVLVGMVKKLFRNRSLLTGRELLIIWILTVLASGIAYTGLARTFFINLTAPYYYATMENRWAEVLHPLLPEAWYPQNQVAIETFYEGLAGGRAMGWLEVCRHIPWGAWLVPLAVWSSFILLCYGVMLCLINLISRQWLHNERMNMPLLRVPQLMEKALDQGQLGSFFMNRFLLTGLLLAAGLHLINGLNFYFPSIPQIPTLVLAGPYFPKYGLFSGFHKLKIYIYPAFIGFAFLTSRQISFSFWFFFILGALLVGLLHTLGYTIPASSLGVTFGPTLTRPEETQMIGAYLVFFLFILWLGRHDFIDIIRSAINPRKTSQSRTEWFDPRLSFWGAVLGTMGIVFWCHHFGQQVWVSIVLVIAFFVVMLVGTRVICQGGVAYFTLSAAPLDGIISLFGPRIFTHMGILIAAVVQKILFVDLRESLMPSLLHAGKLTHREHNRKVLLFGIGATLVLALTLSFVAMMALCYKYGARELPLDWATRTTVAVYDNVQTLIESPAQTDSWVKIFTAAGAFVMLVLVVCYHRAYWWPIHPIGYLTAYSSAMRILWFSFFLGWLCNTLCMRYGGVVVFRRLRFLFVGFIIGDFLMAGIWAVAGIFSDAAYQVLPT